ncbi:MAG: universal stress protein [Verrucomicrobiota bacterium]|jgi:nucleotide-binding universal stress UspA family protein
MKRILVPLALSDGAYAGPAIATHFAEACEAGLVLLHVVRCGFAEPAALLEEILREAQAQLAAIAAPFRSRVPVETVVRTGSPADIIAQEARKNGADAIVMTTHGCRGWRKWLHRNTAGHVLKAATCPVWLVAPGISGDTFTLTLANWSSGRPAHIDWRALAFVADVLFPEMRERGRSSPLIFHLRPTAGRVHLRENALLSVLQHHISPIL